MAAGERDPAAYAHSAGRGVMKVLHVNEHLAHKGGVETYLLALLPRLEARGIETAVAYSEGDPELHEAAYAAPAIREARFGSESAAEEQLHAILQAEQPTLIHVHNVQNIGALKACLAYGPTVVTTHDYRWVCPANSFFYKRTQEVCERTCGLGCFTTTLTKHCVTPRPHYAAYFYHRTKWAIRHASAFARVIAPSQGAKARYDASGFGDASTSVLPYFCELEPADAPRPVPDRPTITYLGRVAPNKGHEYFIQALGRLPDAVQGVMVGDVGGDTADGLRALAREQGCDNRLELRPWASRDEVLDLLDRTTVFVFPSLWPETLGIVGIEALSRGVPVGASDLGGVREWCVDGETGFVVPPKDPEAISAAVQRLLEAPERLAAMGRRGIELIHATFRPHVHVDQLVEHYEAAIEVTDCSPATT